MVISRIRKIMVNNTIDDHDEIIFGSTAKLLMGMNVKSRNRKAKQKKYSEIEEIYKPNERF